MKEGSALELEKGDKLIVYSKKNERKVAEGTFEFLGISRIFGSPQYVNGNLILDYLALKVGKQTRIFNFGVFDFVVDMKTNWGKM